MDMEELMAPEDLFNDSAGDFLGLMGPLSLTHSGDSAARHEARRTAMEVGQVNTAGRITSNVMMASLLALCTPCLTLYTALRTSNC